MSDTIRKIVIVGGGAGGLELATKLTRLLRHDSQITITLVDSTLTHLWKPLWHEVAAGTLNPYEEELNYIAYAYKNHFYFYYGSLIGLDRKNKTISLSAIIDEQDKEIIPARSIGYDLLIIAIGSISNDFNTKGVRENCFYLDSLNQAEYFQRQLIKKILYSQNELTQMSASEITIAIVGGGATGVELAAELHYAINQAALYSHSAKPDYVIKISIIEASERILPALPERLSQATMDELAAMGINVYTKQRVMEVTSEGLSTDTGLFIKADIKIWAAGIKGSEVLSKLDGLEVNKINQLKVNENLQTTVDENIFAFGDCASCPQSVGDYLFVPPRAQAAHQQAMLLARSLKGYLHGKPLLNYHYNDYGSLVTLSRTSTLGSVMGKLLSSLFIQGKIARLVYLMLYKKHQAALHGYWHVFIASINDFLDKRIKPRLKLH